MRSLFQDRPPNPAFHATRSGAQAAVAASTLTVAAFNVADGAFDTNGSRFQAVEGGWYHFAGMLTVDAPMTAAGAYWDAVLMKNGASLKEMILTQQANAGGFLRVPIATTVLLRTGDYMQLGFVHNDTASHAPSTSAAGSYFSGHRVG